MFSAWSQKASISGPHSNVNYESQWGHLASLVYVYLRDPSRVRHGLIRAPATPRWPGSRGREGSLRSRRDTLMERKERKIEPMGDIDVPITGCWKILNKKNEYKGRKTLTCIWKMGVRMTTWYEAGIALRCIGVGFFHGKNIFTTTLLPQLVLSWGHRNYGYNSGRSEWHIVLLGD